MLYGFFGGNEVFYFSVSACQIVVLFDIGDLAAIKENINELKLSFNRNY